MTASRLRSTATGGLFQLRRALLRPKRGPLDSEETKPTSDDIASLADSVSISTTTSSSLMSGTLSSVAVPVCEDDPFADVREEMEARVQAQKAAAAGGEGNTDPHQRSPQPSHVNIPTFVAYTVYFAYAVLILVGHVRDFFAYLFGGRFTGNGSEHNDRRYYAPLLKSWEHFYTRRLYTRIQDCFNRPIASNPGAHIQVLERVSYDWQKSMKVVGPVSRQEFRKRDHRFCKTHDQSLARYALNLGSYNYLGFADDWQETCAASVHKSLEDLPVSVNSSRNEFGTTVLHRKLEQTVAEFLNKQDALCLNMGFNTNATTIPALVGKGDLILSDALNHTSIVNGARASGAAVRIFRHNDVEHLREILKQAIVMGRPRTRRPWNKILVVVEGIYSMEGEYPDLKNIVKASKEFGAYVYLDEAHSIGAMGPTGRGITEYLGVDTADVDIMMGTFTKSFGAMGGYIAGDKHVIDCLRQKCAASSYHNALSPVVCQQIITAFEVISGKDGTNIGKKKLQDLRDNSNYFRMKLNDMGLLVLGQYDSPIMPVMLYNPTKIGAFSRECLKRNLAVVVVGFPAVPILESRARFCISAGHTREDLDYALRQIDEIADILKLRYRHRVTG